MRFLLNKLSKIQEKPESHRRMIAIILVIAFSPFVLMIWFSTSSFGASQEPSVNSGDNYYYEADAENSDSHNPFRVLGEIFGQFGRDMKETAGEVTEELETLSDEYYNQNQEIEEEYEEELAPSEVEEQEQENNNEEEKQEN